MKPSTHERGIGFTAAMFAAAWDGSKTNTRRIIVPTQSTPRVAPLRMEPWIIDGEWQHNIDGDGLPMWAGFHPDYIGEAKWFTCPYGGPGWRLWAKETIAYVPATAYAASPDVPQTPNPNDPSEVAIYRHGWDRSKPAARWRGGRLMPKWAARLWLEVIEVRAERVQDISEVDAIAEGVDAVSMAAVPRQATMNRRSDFKQLWDSINAKRGYGWDANPWVWRIAFRKVGTQ
jgi:hypothetical protein